MEKKKMYFQTTNFFRLSLWLVFAPRRNQKAMAAIAKKTAIRWNSRARVDIVCVGERRNVL